jgi:ubiquinone/menaquinone biosynthesis C-methylase UbiE
VEHMGEHHHDHTGDADLAELLDLDGDVLTEYWTDALAMVADATTGAARVLDLGAGSGVGTIALAQRFVDAEVIAVDVSAEMLKHVRAKAAGLGPDRTIHIVHADLDGEWPRIDPVDLTWASMSLHHLAEPDRVLADLFATTRPGGLLAVAEMSEPLRFLPDDLGFGRPGLERRCLDALNHEHAHSVPELGSDWSPRIEAAGFTVVSERTFAIEMDPPQPPRAARYAQLWLQRMRSGLAHQLPLDDLDTLTTLIDGDGPDSLQHRDDLQIRGSRTLTLARRH